MEHTIKPGTPEHGTPEQWRNTGPMAKLRNTGGTTERWRNNRNVTEKWNKRTPGEQRNSKTTSRNTTNTERRHN